ncbi:MAG: NTP transferase domain-containing protein [Bacteroidales bacterium]|nr:NTP transferase domain-containing protein [Bacteroidales bacterium]
MQAVILAGGKGIRLKPYTENVPKPMLTIMGYPVLEIIIRQLQQEGFREVVIAVNHLKQKIQAYFENGGKWDIKISYSEESEPLGTAGPLKKIKNLHDDFLVVNGDILTDLHFSDFFHLHKKNRPLCTVASYAMPFNIDFGVLKIDQNNELTDYLEKPRFNYDISMGVYGVNKNILDYIPSGESFDMPHLINKLTGDNKKVTAYPHKGHWFDIGSSNDYKQAENTFKQHKSDFLDYI